jgi:hypothetical protein
MIAPRVAGHRNPMRARLAAAALLLPLQAGPALAQTLGPGDGDDISLWRVLAALLLCMVLAIAGAFALKARPGLGRLFSFAVKHGKRRLHLVETLRLNHQIDLCIVDCDGQELLVAASARGAELLGRMPLGGLDGVRTDARP